MENFPLLFWDLSLYKGGCSGYMAIFVFPMQKIRKYHILAFTGIVFASIVLASFLFPAEGLNLGLFRLKTLSSDQLLFEKEIVKKDISSIVESVDTSLLNMDDQLTQMADSSDGNLGAPVKVNYSMNSASSVRSNKSFDAQMELFVQKLNAVSGEKKKIHILHYGDSQIEGDRMTSFIRQRIQEQFGGFGPGLIPAVNVYPTFTFVQSYSENFARYTCFGGDKLASRKYGLMNSAARFSPEKMDSTSTIEKEAWIEIGPGKSAYARARVYNNVKMFYNSCTVACTVSVFQGENLIHQEALNTDGKYHTLKLSFPQEPGKLRFVFKGTHSPNIMGFSMEGDFGVQVDNVGMRGSSGTFFGSIDQGLFATQMSELNADMIIMQFGGNSIPAIKDSAAVVNFARYIRGQLLTLKKLRPNAAILMIGPSDMSTLIDGQYQTYPLLPYTVEQLKKATEGVGVGYWDLYDAMGGMNSMPAWVEKGLAGQDYIHFTNKGASIAAQLFYDAFMKEYLKYNGN